MLRTTTFAGIFVLSAIATLALAQQKSVVARIETGKPVDVVPGTPPFKGSRAAVDVAILLDTSNSMDGLISQAKSQLWTIVQQFAQAKKNGQTPMLRVALFEYGNTRLPASEGFLRQVLPLSDDLDKLSQALFALTTNGGDEYCGQVINEAITRLDWSKEPGGYKAIFIAGNEPFTQGPVDYRTACKRAIEHGVVVNTIHCGNSESGRSGQWHDGARIAEGEFFNIDQDRVVVPIRCPQDEIIIRLSGELNNTYLWYGGVADRREYAANQAQQDANARTAGRGAEAARAAAKATSLYTNQSRDLVDAVREDKSVLSRLKKEELPEPLKALAPAELEARVHEVANKRGEIQKQINELARQRESYLAEETKRLAQDTGATTLGDAMVTSIRKQLAKTGFENTAK